MKELPAIFLGLILALGIPLLVWAYGNDRAKDACAARGGHIIFSDMPANDQSAEPTTRRGIKTGPYRICNLDERP